MDFVVAGGGIGGSVVAELLARAGKRVLVLERGLSAPKWTRPEIFWPATADFVRELAAGERWEAELASPIEAFDIHDGRAVRELVPAASLRQASVRPWSTDPNGVIEAVGLLREKGAGSRVVGLRAREIATGKELEFGAHWTIADDGVESVVRRECGIGIELQTFAIEFLCLGPDWPAALPPSRVRLWVNRGGTASGILALGIVPLPRGRATSLVVLRRGALEKATGADWESFLDHDPLLREITGGRKFPEGFAHVRRAFGHAERYGVDGAILLGDAAHPVSPAGGQGSSMAVADARALAEILLGSSSDPVAELERRRRGPNTRSLAITRLVHRIWTLPGWCRPTPGFYAMLAVFRARPSILARTVRDVSTRFLEEPVSGS